MIYAGFILLVLFIFSILFVIVNLIREHYMEQYIQKIDGTIYNYIGIVYEYGAQQVLHVLQSTKTGNTVVTDLETLNKNFIKK